MKNNVTKIMAIVITILMVMAMIPMAAGAATPDVKFTLNCTKPDYTFTIYQLATIDTATGIYTTNANIDSSIASLITDATTVGEEGSKAITTACDKITDAAKLGTAIGTYTSNTGATNYTVPGGLYYIKATTTPATVKSVTNSVLALPYYKDNAWVSTYDTIELSPKVNNGNVVVTKTLLTPADQTAGVGDTVSFNLKASVVGSAEKKLQKFAITDTMSAGLTYGSITSVKLTGSTTGAEDRTLTAAEYSVVTPYTASNGDAKTFAVKLSDSLIAEEAFYGYTNVEVEYTATLNKSAVTGTAGNPNSDGLDYTNVNGTETYVNGTEVKVYTYAVKVLKLDANDAAKVLSGAEFSIKNSAGTVIAKATTGNDGYATFMMLDASGNATTDIYKFDTGTYTMTETKAPDGYSLNSTSYNVNISTALADNEGYVTVTATDTKTFLPATGGAGTLVFTISGAALIVFAGVMLMIFKRRKIMK